MARAGEVLEESDFEKMIDIRARIDAIVEDHATADALKPWFSLYCKRPCFHDEYLQMSIAITSRWSIPKASASTGSPRRGWW